MSDTPEPIDRNAELREEVAFNLRMLAQGRPAFAAKLAELLVPVGPAPAPEMVQLPVIEVDIPDEPAKTTKRAKKAAT